MSRTQCGGRSWIVAQKGGAGARLLVPMDFGLLTLGYLVAGIGKTGGDNSQISFWHGIIIRTDGASNAVFMISGGLILR